MNCLAFIGFTSRGAILPSWFYGVNVSTTPEREGQFQIFTIYSRHLEHGDVFGRSVWLICSSIFVYLVAQSCGLPTGKLVYILRGAEKTESLLGQGEALVPPTFLRSIEDSGFSTWLRESESPFAFYFVLLFHTFGLALLVGANAVMDLRILGVAREIPLAPLKRLFRIMWIGFGINAFTGVLLILAYPTKALTNPVFYTKLTLIALAIWIITLLRDRVFGDASLDEIAMMARGATLAKWSLFLWVGAISAGRLLAYTYKYLTYPC